MRVLVTGIFDLLHVEHVRFLAAAKTAGESRRHFFDTLGQEPSLISSSPLGQSESKVLSGSSSIVSKMPSSTHLIVGIESDKRVRKLKGRGRPVMGQEDRKEMLMGLKMVDEVMILPEDFDNDEAYEKILRDLKVDVYAVSQNSPYLENKRRICNKAGVELRVVHGYNPEYSTSNLIKKIENHRERTE